MVVLKKEKHYQALQRECAEEGKRHDGRVWIPDEESIIFLYKKETSRNEWGEHHHSFWLVENWVLRDASNEQINKDLMYPMEHDKSISSPRWIFVETILGGSFLFNVSHLPALFKALGIDPASNSRAADLLLSA
ncbi:hypothetical protein ACFLY0_01385 [Patescibacteria group bacterium]